MSFQEWLALGQAVIMAIAGAFVWVLGRENAARSRWEKDIEEQLDDVRLEKLRRIFMTIERYNDLNRLRRFNDDDGTPDRS